MPVATGVYDVAEFGKIEEQRYRPFKYASTSDATFTRLPKEHDEWMLANKEELAENSKIHRARTDCCVQPDLC